MIRRLLDWLLSLSGEFCGDPMCTICGPVMERTRRRLRRRRSFLK